MHSYLYCRTGTDHEFMIHEFMNIEKQKHPGERKEEQEQRIAVITVAVSGREALEMPVRSCV